MNKKMLVTAVMAAVASVGFVMSASAEETMSTDVSPVVVEGQADVLPGGLMKSTDRVGILGDMKAVDVPFTERQYSQKTIEMFEDPNQPLNGVLANNPSITVGSHNPLTTDFSMRGMNMNGTQYTVNNVPSMYSQFMTIPTYVMESIDITSGPNTVLNGATNAQDGQNADSACTGRLNATTKKATDKDINRYIQKFSGRGTWTEGIEVGRRLGKNKEWGVLVNARQDKGKLAMKGGRIEDKSIYINVDRKGEHAKTNIFGGYFDKSVQGAQRWLHGSKFDTNKPLPSVFNLKNNYSFDGQFKDINGYVMTLNHEQKLSDKWSAFANMGFSSNKQHYNDYSQATIFFKNDGTLDGTKFRDYYAKSYTGYMQFGVNDTTDFKDGKNQLSFAYDYLNYRNKGTDNGSKYTIGAFSGNLFNGIIDNGNRINGWNEFDKLGWKREAASSLTVADKLEYKKSSLYTAVQYRMSRYEQPGDRGISGNNWNPTFAYAYKPENNLSIYASYATSFTRARLVSASYNNKGEVLDSVKNKQTEIGVKYENGGVMHSLALFDIDQHSFIDESSSAGPKYQIYTTNGVNNYKGIEYYATGKVAPKWNLMGGFMYLNSEIKKLKQSEKNFEGNRVTGAPRWNFVLATEYEIDKNNSLYGRINACTDSVLDKAGKMHTPGYATVDLGYTHKFKLGPTDVKLNATCYNLLGKDYWHARGSAPNFTLGAPRTFMLSATFDI